MEATEEPRISVTFVLAARTIQAPSISSRGTGAIWTNAIHPARSRSLFGSGSGNSDMRRCNPHLEGLATSDLKQGARSFAGRYAVRVTLIRVRIDTVA